MSYPQHGPRPGPPPGGFRPGPPPGGEFRPGPPVPAPVLASPPVPGPADHPAEQRVVTETGHPAVDAVLQSLPNAARLPPPDKIADYEPAHQVLQETLAGIDG